MNNARSPGKILMLIFLKKRDKNINSSFSGEKTLTF
jgi:hypothetical protein